MQKKSLKEEHIHKLANYHIKDIDFCDSVLLQFEPGEVIVREGMPMEHLLFVVDGKAKVCSSTANGKDLLLCYYISEGIIGDIELMNDMYIASTTVNSITEFSCIGLPYIKYADILKTNLEFVNWVGRELSIKLLRSSKNSAITALYSGEERLCAYILLASQNNIFLETLTDVSKTIGISYRHMLRILNRLCLEGVISKEPSGYRIVEPVKLSCRTQDFYMK